MVALLIVRILYMSSTFRLAAASLLALSLAAPAQAQYRNTITHDRNQCSGDGPAVWLQVTNIDGAAGTVRVQLYRGTKADWLESGRWLNRIEVPARAGSMSICMPVPSAGNYAIAVRHDKNNNGKTDLSSDGGGMSNNPSINIFNLGKPGIDKTRFAIGSEVKTMSIRMRYL